MADCAKVKWRNYSKALTATKVYCYWRNYCKGPNALIREERNRTDYWLSQGRKFCEFCKCSIADNKASIQFHENGKKHKNNVSKRLTEMQKKAAKEAKAALDFEKEIKRMEAAALKSYKNDVQSFADYTSQLIRQGVEKLPEAEYVEPASSKPKAKPKKPDKAPVLEKKWMEAKTEEGQSYYWNVDTKESVWEPPAEGFASLEEQQNQKAKPNKKPSKPGKKFKKGKFQASKIKPKPKSEPKPEEEKVEEKIDLPLPYVPPFGKWKKVEPPKEGKVDLQLPKQEWVEVAVPKIKEEPERSFKFKTTAAGVVASSAGETGFKKRKIAQDAKRNIRQRLDDD